MTAFATIMAITWFLAGILMWWVGFKAGQGTLPKNKWIGIRTPALLASDEAWIKGHQAASGFLKAGSLPLFVGAAICLIADDSLIGWVSLPVVVLLTFMVLYAAKKAESTVVK